MKERPILFSAPMVRAILAGTKTQTRRVVKGAPEDWLPIGPEVFSPTVVDRHGDEQPGPDAYGAGNEDGDYWIRCPYGQPGDRLWVKETARCIALSEQPAIDQGRIDVDYKAGGGTSREYPLHEPLKWFPSRSHNVDDSPRWQPAIHMPRWASRITLEVTGVRVERLRDISNEDALAEGVSVHKDHHHKRTTHICSPHQAYRDLWESINGPASWDANPWVWVVEFRQRIPTVEIPRSHDCTQPQR